MPDRLSPLMEAVEIIRAAHNDRGLSRDESLCEISAMAIGFGLKLGCDMPAESTVAIGSSHEQNPLSQEHNHQLVTLVDSFATSIVQEQLKLHASCVGIPPLAAMVYAAVALYGQSGWASKRQTPEDDASSIAAFCLSFALLLANRHSAVAYEYRDQVPE